MAERDEGWRQHGLLLVLHDDGEALKHPNLYNIQQQRVYVCNHNKVAISSHQ